MDSTKLSSSAAESNSDDELTGSPAALGRLFAGGTPWRFTPKRLAPAQRIARRKAIFGSFTRAISRAPHRLVVLGEKESQRVVLQEKPRRSFDSINKRERKRMADLLVSAKAIPGSNRKPRKGPSAEQRRDIKRREAKRLAHEARTALGLEMPL